MAMVSEIKDCSHLSENRRSIWLVLDLAAKKRGSLEEQLLRLASHLSAAGIRVTFVFSTEAPDWLREDFVRAGAKLRSLDFRRPASAHIQFWQWMRDERPDLVHFHFVRAHSPMTAIAKLFGARVLVHDHLALGVAFREVAPRNGLVNSVVRTLKRVRGTITSRIISRRIAVSSFVATSLMKAEFVQRSRVDVIEHGIDVAKLTAIDGQQFRDEIGSNRRRIIACVSRLGPEKGVDVLIRAFARLDGDDAILVLAGDGPEASRCRELAIELGVLDRVRFLGLRNDVATILAGCDIAVVPSRAPEAFGLAVVEAMAVGKPVVVSDTGAMPEIVEHGECGFVVAAGDDFALAGALTVLLRDPSTADRLGRAAQRRAHARYSIDLWLSRTIDLYRKFVSIKELEVTERRSAAA